MVDPGFYQKGSISQKRMTGVVKDGPAYRAGIRDGQDLFRWSIDNDDPSKDALLGVVIDGQRKLITFSPARQRAIEQYRAAVEGDAARSCMPF